MTVVGIHPEDLLDKLARAQISEGERAHLEAHLQICEVCRFELELRDDFALLSVELGRGTATAPRLVAEAPSPRARGRRPPRWLWATGLAAVVVVTGAVASPLARRWQASEAEVPPPSAKPAPVAVVAKKQRAPVMAPRSEPSKEAVVTPAAERTPKVVASQPRSFEVAPAARAPAAPTAVHAAEAPPVETASTLFAAANLARRKGDLGRATELYRTLQKRFPGTQEAELSLVTMATLQLDNGNTSAALSSFDAYLSRGGRPLQAEALVGRAVGLRRLGRLGEEAETWRLILRRYPGTAHAEQAKARLRKLGAQ